MPSQSPDASGDVVDDDQTGIGFAQSLLPRGLVLIHQLAGPVHYGMAFKAEDRRLVGAPPVVRRIQLVEARSTETWRDKWLSQLCELSTNAFHHVCRPLEFGSAGADHVYLVFDWFPATLAQHIPATGLINPRIVQSLLSQLVAGLEESHGRLGAHGALSADLVFLDSNTLSEDTHLWIGGVELGHQPFWTNGARLVPKANQYFPPEWQGRLQEPSKSADVFALGLIAVELIAGRTARAGHAAAPATTAESALQILKQRSPWWKRPQFVPQLLSQFKRRPADGVAARRWFDWWHWCESAVVPASATAVVILMILIVIMWHEQTLRRDRDALRDRLISVDRSLISETERSQRLTDQNTSLLGQFAEATTSQAVLQRELEEERKQRPTPQPDRPSARTVWSETLGRERITDQSPILDSLKAQVSGPIHNQLVAWSDSVKESWAGIENSLTPEQRKAVPATTRREAAYYKLRREPWNATLRSDLGKSFWHDFVAGGKSPEEKLAAIEAHLVKVPAKNWLREELSRYLKSLRAHRAQWVRWEGQPTKLTQAWRDRIDAPWDVEVQLREEQMLAALIVAESEWRDVDRRGDLTWDDFQRQLEKAAAATGNQLVERIASVWINDFNNATVVAFQPVQGTSPKGSGSFRTVDVHVKGSQYALDNDLTIHTWLVETAHSYPATTPPIKTPWQVGQTIQIKVYGGRITLLGGARPLYIDLKFTGPIAVWRLAQRGTISTGEHSLKVRVLNCPGPPPPAAEMENAVKLVK